MNQLDLFYRAYKQYKKETGEGSEYSSFHDAVAEADINGDNIRIEYNVCTVESDWIDAIEKGLVYVEKAIREERQFIRSNGEVVPVEKAKHVSKDSVVHLARHSNLITKEPEEGEDLLPEKIYTVEKLSDFAVYENRFLYMLLCYLRDFISLRYNKIMLAASTYKGELTVDKTIVHRWSRINYSVKMSEEKTNDPYLTENNGIKDVLEHINLLLKVVVQLINTPLMQETAKAAMLKPPITKTNVLKMNQNFKNAVELYEYVSAYVGDGYTITKETKVFSPFREDVADEFADIVMMNSFLTYEHGLGIERQLKLEYDREELRRKEEESQRQKEQLLKLKKRAVEKSGSLEEYAMLLEKRNKKLEDDSVMLTAAREEIQKLNENTEKLNKIISEKDEDIRLVQEQRTAERLAAEREKDEIKTKFRKEIGEMNEQFDLEKKQLTDRFFEEKEALQQAFSDEKERLDEACRQAVANAEEKISANVAECDKKIVEMNEKVSAADKQTKDTLKQYEDLLEKHRLVSARLFGMRQKYGLIDGSDDMSAEPDFNELEMQYKSFKTYFDKQWGVAKGKIRKEVFFSKKKTSDEEKTDKKPTPDENEQ